MPFSLVFQIVLRAFLWIILFSAEIIAPVLYMAVPGNYWVYIALIAVAISQFIAFSYLKDERTVRDMRDLCIYEGLANIIGLYFFLNGTDPRNGLIVILGTLLFLKYGRLLWRVKSSEKNGCFVAWPAFGILGWYAKRRQLVGDETSVSPNVMQVRQFYIFVTLCLATGIVLPKLGVAVASWHVAVIAFLFAPVIAKRVLADMKRQNIAYLQSLEEATIARERAAAERERADAQQELAAEKERHNRQLAATNAELALANAEIQALLAQQARDKALLEKFNESLRDAAHDLQHPMAVVRSHADSLIALREEADSDQEQWQGVVQKLDIAMEEMTDMIDASVHSAQVVTGIIAPNPQVIDMDALLNEFMSLWLNGPNRRGLDHLLVYPRHYVGLYCVFDLVILKRILRNLIANAIQHSVPGSGILITLRRRGGNCVIQVRDSGPGIAEGMGKDKVANFAAFAQRIRAEGSQVKPSGQRSGYRLGMSNVLQLCAATGLEMQLCAKPGRGSMFSFSLPLASPGQINETRRLRVAQEAEWEEAEPYLEACADIAMPHGDFLPDDSP